MTAYSTAPLPSSSGRRPIRAAIGGLLALGLGLAGCSAGTAGAEPARVAAPAAFPVEIDEPGAAEAVVIEEEPNRIAVLSPDAAIALHEIGATERVIAIPDAATSATLNPHAEQMADVEHVIGGHTSPEPEQVLAWDPDLVVITARHTGEQDASERLSAAGVPVLTLMNGWSTSDAVAENIEILGRATGLSDAADALADEIVGGVADIRERAEGAGEQPTVAILSNQAQTPFINAGSSLVADIVANGGGASAAAQIGIDKTMPVQPEQLVAMDPDCIMLVDVTGKGEASFDELLAHPAIAALPAVADDRVALFPGRQMYGLAGREVVSASERVLEWLHPDLAE
ncbi:MAG: ABC transporter substrate-binding protein [Candidatus Microbacterium stercoravium]